MAPKKRTVASKPAPVPAPVAQPSPAAQPVSVPVLPLQHYLSILPLQHAAIYFCLLQSVRSADVPASSSFFSKLSPSPVINSLVAQPVRTLFIAATTIALVQAYYGNWVRGVRSSSLGLAAKERGEVRQKKGFFGAFGDMKKDIMQGRKPALPSRKGAEKTGAAALDFLGGAIVVTLGGACTLHVAAVLLGAPLVTRVPETFLMSLIISNLALLPIAIAIPPSMKADTQERYIWLRLFSKLSPANDVEVVLLAPALGALVGAWSGALPIPLDWDRPWQVWPTTPVIGALTGHLVGSLAGMVLCVLKAFKGNSVADNAEKSD